MAGWKAESCGYHGDDGKKFYNNGRGKIFGPTFGVDDTVGAGLDLASRSCFFTKNGLLLGVAVSGKLRDVSVNMVHSILTYML